MMNVSFGSDTRRRAHTKNYKGTTKGRYIAKEVKELHEDGKFVTTQVNKLIKNGCLQGAVFFRNKIRAGVGLRVSV